jgi:hypothetical protein
VPHLLAKVVDHREDIVHTVGQKSPEVRVLIAGQGIKTLLCYAYISITKYQKLALKKASSKPSKPPI